MTHYPAAAAPYRRAAAPGTIEPQRGAAPMRQLYLALGDAADPGHPAVAAADDWLRKQLETSHGRPVEGAPLPSDGAGFAAWQQQRMDAIDEQYKQYVAERRAGAPRRLFSGRAHALHYLTALAPGRLTDGAWLYSVLARWDDTALHPLIATYLEELGNGVPDKNHVVIFQQLIDAHGCGGWQRLDDHHFHGGLTQLALAHHGERYLPELIGYNLGAEHASFDTLVAAYELNELGIDPYYFTLHVSVDNNASGHARLALDALARLTPDGADEAAAFLRRVDAGYRLHAAAPASGQLLAGFDLRRELHAALAGKHVPATLADGAANPAHAVDFGGRRLGDWLADPEQAPALLDTLERDGWIVRGQDAAGSRLWRLIGAEYAAHADGEAEAEHGAVDTDAAPPLAGLFSAYELALLADWIAADGAVASHPPAAAPLHQPTPPRRIEESAERGIIRHRFPDDEHGWEALSNELSLLEARVVASASKEEAMALLAALMAPSNHHTSTGLMATRMFSKLYAA